MSDVRPGPWEFYVIELYIHFNAFPMSSLIESLVLMPASPMVVHTSAL